ncbi:HAMP domain-containing histidine kinase [Flavobacterium oreochromis]|nr:HAMP domain-containing histidine kinase [Flavobacterium oreochromis]
MIESKVEKMDHLIQGILTYSKIDTLESVYEEVDTNEIVQNTIQIIHIPENVQVIIASTLPTITADRYRMQQLFQNLISNAVTYIDKPLGKVIVDYEDNHDSHLFSISDNGPGIAPENQEKIFTIFQSFTKHEKSTGIGLSIVKKIIENYKGQIWLESQENIGTTFFIKIPKKIT